MESVNEWAVRTVPGLMGMALNLHIEVARCQWCHGKGIKNHHDFTNHLTTKFITISCHKFTTNL